MEPSPDSGQHHQQIRAVQLPLNLQRHAQCHTAGIESSNPDDNTIMMAPGHEIGFGFFTNVTIDQHVDVRRRQYDLTAVIKLYLDLLGLGLDKAPPSQFTETT